MTLTLTVVELTERFPTFRVAVALLQGMQAGGATNTRVEAFAAAAEQEARAALQGKAPADFAETQDWRAAYRAFGSKKTSYRNACEALLRRIQREGSLPRVLPLVDLYNALSIKYRIPAGADDLAKLVPPLAFRYARPGDSFYDLASDPAPDKPLADDPPAEGEVIYADSEKCLCRRWNWRQDARSRVTEATTDAVVVLQTLAPDGAERLTQAAEDLDRIAGNDLGAACSWAVASADEPQVALPFRRS